MNDTRFETGKKAAVSLDTRNKAAVSPHSQFNMLQAVLLIGLAVAVCLLVVVLCILVKKKVFPKFTHKKQQTRGYNEDELEEMNEDLHEETGDRFFKHEIDTLSGSIL